jgi:steroid delta-isomerase-like uncharacterized protein
VSIPGTCGIILRDFGCAAKGEDAMPDSETVTLRRMREDIVRRHIDAENNGDVEGVLASFHRPRYHVVPSGEITEGEPAVRELMTSFLKSFPDFRFEQDAIHHADRAVVLEGRITGTHRAEWAGLKPGGRRLDVRVACVFDFDGPRLMNETVYFDFATAQRQLTAAPG